MHNRYDAPRFRVTLNTDSNLFVVYMAGNDALSAHGVTIEEAKMKLVNLLRQAMIAEQPHSCR
ncbi:hypothetical protein [Vagococcus acidifermentans]|uniref:Uncharacterized protein n=1 Tax=Vagococcus acidifermentans TaxID=564710 RepID=A0A430AQ64_9ENTE|nr:hypothetical protein [Vagococcus acidifermentans]RSU10262.1 hypothetical protein CBF27_10985 [Vagococcus acidifermentans]